ERDLTSDVSWAVSDALRATITADGKLAALKDGAVTVTANLKTGSRRTASAKVQIKDIAASREFSFGLDIGGILTRQGCNGAACHGGVKGRGGFKLSAGALHPNDDFEWIVKGGTYQVLTAEVKGVRVPRIDLANPEKSLILQKATGSVPHGGGKRFAVGSPE